MKLLPILAAALLISAPARAGSPGLVNAHDPEALLKLVKGFGSADLMGEMGGPTWIRGQTDGIVYGILFLGCQDADGCGGVAFNAQWEDVAVTAAQIADWNLRQRYVKAFVDETGRTVLEMDLNLRHGVTVENFEDSVQRWNAVMSGFQADVVNKAPPSRAAQGRTSP